MAFTYLTERTRDLDLVRAAIGDVDAAAALLSDEEITAVLASTGSVAAAASQFAGELVLRFARKPVRLTADGTMLDYSERLSAWRALAASGGSSDGSVTGWSVGTVALTNEVAW